MDKTDMDRSVAGERIRKVVVVDDDSDVHDLIRAFFRTRSFEVESFESAEQAIEASRTRGDEWDVVLVDLNLPEMSGIEFTTQIKKSFPHLPVILITTSKNAEVAVEAIKKGAYDFIVKPIHFPQLQISVERAIHLKDLNEDMSELRQRVRTPAVRPGGMIGKSPKFVLAVQIASRVAKSRASIFISGETGTGKEVFAKFIHAESGRSNHPFVAINCSAIPENLLESELFGHAKGAFTGAQEKKIGLFEEAGQGTIFLDEIGDLGLPLQAKLLRVLQERKIKRLGENQLRPISCRVISATHKDLKTEVKEGRFREDLFFRLNVIPINLPPLRERQEDIVPLAEAFLKKFALENSSAAKSFSKEALRLILAAKWRGNVRELENCIERAVILCDGSEVTPETLIIMSDEVAEPFRSPDSFARDDEKVFWIDCSSGLPRADDVMNAFVEFAVGLNGGARDRTARELGIDRKTLYKRMKAASPQARAMELTQ